MGEPVPIGVLLADSERSRRSRIRQILDEDAGIRIIGEASSLNELLELLEEHQPQIVLIGDGLLPEGALASAEAVFLSPGAVPTILISSQEDLGQIRAAMAAGVRDYLVWPVAPGALIQAIERIAMVERRRSSASAESPGVARGQVIAVCAGKGGTGRTTLACNLAAVIAAGSPRKTVLFDMDLQFGGTALLLNLTVKRGLLDIGHVEEEMDAELLGYYLTPHECGLQLLVGALSPQPYEQFQSSQIESIFRVLRRLASYVIVDAPPILGEALFGCLSAADQVLVVITPEDLVTLRNTRTFLDAVTETLGDMRRIRLIINRAGRHSPIPESDIEKALGLPILARIADDVRLVRGSVNHGVPFVLSNPGAPASQEIKRLASAVIARSQPQQAEPANAGRALLSRGLLGMDRGER